MASRSSSRSSSEKSRGRSSRRSRRRSPSRSQSLRGHDEVSVLGGLSVRTTQSKRSGRSSCKQELLPIDHSAAKACKCGFCGCSSGDPSPVPTDSADDCVPWASTGRQNPPLAWQSVCRWETTAPSAGISTACLATRTSMGLTGTT